MNAMRFAAMCVLMATASQAQASGALVSPSALPPSLVVELREGVASARAEKPEAFAAVADVRRRLPELDAKKRGRLLPVSPILKSMGEDALYPLVEALVFTSDRAGLSDSAWSAWRIGILETLGMLRKPELTEVFEAAVVAAGDDFQLARAGAEALGRLGTKDAAAKLLRLVERPGSRDAVLSAMGACRRVEIARALAAALPELEGEHAARVIKSLGQVGNAWAWKTPAGGEPSQEAEVRRLAARALVEAFVSRSDELRQAASNALIVVDAPETAALIEVALAKASADQRAALEELRTRFANNPTR